MTDYIPGSLIDAKTLGEIAALVEGSIVGEADVTITGVSGLDDAEEGDIVFAESARFLNHALRSQAAAILTTPQAYAGIPDVSKPLVLVENARLSFVRLLGSLRRPAELASGVHATAQLGDRLRMGEDVRIGANVVIDAGVTLGDRVTIWPGVFVGEGCVVGDDSVLFPNVVLYDRVLIGKRCLVHAGCVLGADGFGYVPVGNALQKVPHLGTVQIGDDVEIGANSCVDRAKTGVTVIGAGAKIDNLAQIAHNVRMGASCIVVAQVGIGGSATIGNGVILAGQVGIKDHVSIGDGARVLAQAGAISDVAAGETVSGYPAGPHTAKMRGYVALAAMPDALKRIRKLEKRLAELEAKEDA